MDMKNRGDALICRAAEMIIVISSVAVIALMAVGGCNNGGHGEPAPTGFPPECDGTFDVDLSCPATSLAGSVCLPYICDVIDDSEEPPMVIDNITIVFGDHCTDTDCFTLECQDISVIGADSATIIIESVSGTPVGEDAEGSVFQGTPDGRIIIDGEEFALDCNGIVTP
jgi:hypothetical protein